MTNVPVTPGVLLTPEPTHWRNHRFGLSEARWLNLQGKTYWVTGAGTGYGRVIAIALGLAGALVFLTGRRISKLEETLQEAEILGADRRRLRVLPADLRNPAAVTDAARTIAGHTGHALDLWGFIHCAALSQLPAECPLRDIQEMDWRTLMDTNVTAAWLAARAAIGLMNRGGRAVLFTSEAGWSSTPGFGPYNVSKAALNNLGMSIAAEVESSMPGADMQINLLDPGEARTEMNQGSQVSPYSAVCMSLLLLSHPKGGPNGCFFHRDGRHLSFAKSAPYAFPLF